ncbi:hypothetical protein QAD02_016922 [Eretmocerus hayati]|uniref:Uncharacterized protein n=1 Tax=Eretmocerus hayati TaxID=131215 RepID=A0ACC2PH95_9HYME|nr:hypothetical protein QAD02_016922 [Eretmocerus hayati]
MRLQILRFTFTMLMLSHSDAIYTKRLGAIDYLSTYVQRNLSSHKVNVVVESLDEKSPFVHRILKGISEKIPVNVFDYKTIHRIDMTDNSTDLSTLTMHRFERISERLILTIGMIVPQNGSMVLLRMNTMLNNFDRFNPLTRGRYLINLITESDVDLKHFFRIAWSRKFLDLTVIKWTQDDRIGKANNNSFQLHSYQGSIYSYNPFYDTLKRQILTTGADLFPRKMNDLNGYPLRILVTEFDKESKLLRNQLMKNDSSRISYGIEDLQLLRSLTEYLNASMAIRISEFISANPNSYSESENIDFLLPIISYYKWRPYYAGVGYETKLAEWFLNGIQIPVTHAHYFYLMREKRYERSISPAAIVAFGGLFFTALVFAIWARLLGFRKRNWSFLNILTAQMGGSIEHRGRMKFSERIFLISIYVATFLVVTLGSDYMFQIFVLQQNLPKIRTIQDLLDSDIVLTVHGADQNVLDTLPTDTKLDELNDRIEVADIIPGTHSFCKPPSTNISILDESINLCISRSKSVQHIMKSDANFQIDKIQDPIGITFPWLGLGQLPSSFRPRIEKLIHKSMQAGLLVKWEKEKLRSQTLEDSSDHPVIVDKDRVVPPRDQLLPIFAVGCSVSIIGLIGEFVWKLFIEKTEFGRIVVAHFTVVHTRTQEIA